MVCDLLPDASVNHPWYCLPYKLYDTNDPELAIITWKEEDCLSGALCKKGAIPEDCLDQANNPVPVACIWVILLNCHRYQYLKVFYPHLQGTVHPVLSDDPDGPLYFTPLGERVVDLEMDLSPPVCYLPGGGTRVYSATPSVTILETVTQVGDEGRLVASLYHT